jgi:hypothetical protein
MGKLLFNKAKKLINPRKIILKWPACGKTYG